MNGINLIQKLEIQNLYKFKTSINTEIPENPLYNVDDPLGVILVQLQFSH